MKSKGEQPDQCTCKRFASNAVFEHEKRKIIVVVDKGSATGVKYELRNESGFHHSLYHVDGGLIKSGCKCDYLLIGCENTTAYFIELKGSDLDHALEQIDKAITELSGKLRGCVINARIVLTRVNLTSLKSNAYKKLQLRLKKLGGDIKQKTSLLSESV